MRYIFVIILSIFVNSVLAQGFTTGAKLNLINYKLRGAMTEDHTHKPTYQYKETSGFEGSMLVMFNYGLIIKRFGDDFAVGLELNAGFGIFGIGNLGGFEKAFVMDFPEYLTIYYGDYSSEDYSFSLGVGYEYTHMPLPYHSPSIMFELGSSDVKFRLSYNPFYYSYYEIFENSAHTYYRKAISFRNTISLSYYHKMF